MEIKIICFIVVGQMTSVKTKMWDRFNLEVRKATCWSCNDEMDIANTTRWEAGHVIPNAKGGPKIVANLRPICITCNRNMGTTDMLTYLKDNNLTPELKRFLGSITQDDIDEIIYRLGPDDLEKSNDFFQYLKDHTSLKIPHLQPQIMNGRDDVIVVTTRPRAETNINKRYNKDEKVNMLIRRINDMIDSVPLEVLKSEVVRLLKGIVWEKDITDDIKLIRSQLKLIYRSKQYLMTYTVADLDLLLKLNDTDLWKQDMLILPYESTRHTHSGYKSYLQRLIVTVNEPNVLKATTQKAIPLPRVAPPRIKMEHIPVAHMERRNTAPNIQTKRNVLPVVIDFQTNPQPTMTPFVINTQPIINIQPQSNTPSPTNTSTTINGQSPESHLTEVMSFSGNLFLNISEYNPINNTGIYTVKSVPKNSVQLGQRGGETVSNQLSYLVTDIDRIDNAISFLQKLYGWPSQRLLNMSKLKLL
jgi:hypothetical protein